MRFALRALRLLALACTPRFTPFVLHFRLPPLRGASPSPTITMDAFPEGRLRSGVGGFAVEGKGQGLGPNAPHGTQVIAQPDKMG